MNIYIASLDNTLMEKLKYIKGIGTVFPFTDLGTLQVEEPAFFIFSDQLIKPNELNYFREKFTVKMLYLISNESRFSLEQIKTLCQTYSIDYIMPGATISDITDYIEEIILERPKLQTSVITFSSGLPQQGLTSSVLAIANHLGTLTSAKIGVLGLNAMNPGIDHLDYKGKTFDQIWGALQSRNFSTEEMYEKSHRLTGNVYYLAGNADIKKFPYMNVDGVHYYIEQAQKAFDLILLDLGAYYDTPLAAQGLIKADLHILHMTQMFTDVRAFERKYKQILEVMDRSKKERMLLLMNHVRDLPGLYTTQEVSEMLGIPIWIKLPYEEMFYQRLVQQSLDSFVGEKYEDAIERAAESLLKQYALPVLEVERHTKKSWFGFGKKAGKRVISS